MGEGIYPKIDGDTLYGSEITNINYLTINNARNIQRQLNGNSIPLSNATKIFTYDLNEDEVTTKTGLTHRPYVHRGEYTIHSSGSYTFETRDLLLNNTASEIYSNVDYEIYDVIDECDDSSIDSSIWTTSTNCSEGTNGLNVQGSGQLLSKDLSSYKYITIFYSVEVNSNSSSSASIQLTDGTNTETIHSLSNSIITIYGELTLNIDWTNKKLFYDLIYNQENLNSNNNTFKTKYGISEYIDLTGWTSLKVKASTGSSNSSARIYWMREINNNPSTTLTYYVSADGGSNYTESDRSITKVGTSGNKLRAKITGTLSSGEVLAIKGYGLGMVN